MSLVKSIGKQKVNLEFNKDFINVFSEKIKSKDSSFINQTLDDLHPADIADLIENLERTFLLPTVDPFKDGTKKIVDHLLESSL